MAAVSVDGSPAASNSSGSGFQRLNNADSPGMKKRSVSHRDTNGHTTAELLDPPPTSTNNLYSPNGETASTKDSATGSGGFRNSLHTHVSSVRHALHIDSKRQKEEAAAAEAAIPPEQGPYKKNRHKVIRLLKWVGILNWLLLLFPVAIALYAVGISPEAQFVTAAIAIIPAAGWMGDATEQLSDSVGPGLGGLLNATFGNAAELIVALFAMYRHQDSLVKASLVGSILGNLLLVLGCAILAGGWKYKFQTFSKNAAGVDSNMAVVAAVAFLVPAIFANIGENAANYTRIEQKLSLGICVILFVAYIFLLFFQLKTHRDFMENFGQFEKEMTKDSPAPLYDRDIKKRANSKEKAEAAEHVVDVKSESAANGTNGTTAQLYDSTQGDSAGQEAPLRRMGTMPASFDSTSSRRTSDSRTKREHAFRQFILHQQQQQDMPANDGGRSTPPLRLLTRAGSLTSATAAARAFVRESRSYNQIPRSQYSPASQRILQPSASEDARMRDGGRQPLPRSYTLDDRITSGGRSHRRQNTITEARQQGDADDDDNTQIVDEHAVQLHDKDADAQHEDVDDDEEEEPKWSRVKSLVVLAIATGLIAGLSEVLTGSVEAFGEDAGLGQIFLGVIIVAIVGNAAEHSTAVMMALADDMDTAISIAFGSALQIAMFVVPVIVFFSYARDEPMDLLLSQFEVFAVAVAAILSWVVVQDGGSNWLEGVMLLVIYVILAIGFFFGPSEFSGAGPPSP